MLNFIFPWKKFKKAKTKASRPSETVAPALTAKKQQNQRVDVSPLEAAKVSNDGRYNPVRMRKGFDNLSPNARRHVQKIMWFLKVHPADPDGIWHPDTDLAALYIADLISYRSQEKTTFNLHTGEDVTRLYTGLRDGKFLDFLPEIAIYFGK